MYETESPALAASASWESLRRRRSLLRLTANLSARAAMDRAPGVFAIGVLADSATQCCGYRNDKKLAFRAVGFHRARVPSLWDPESGFTVGAWRTPSAARALRARALRRRLDVGLA